MTNSINSSLHRPPIRPRMEVRETAIEQSIGTMPEVDKEYMYEKQKQNQYQERVVTAFLKLVRKYDFLPKKVLLEGFQDAVRHIYSANAAEDSQREQEEKFCQKTEAIVQNLQGEKTNDY